MFFRSFPFGSVNHAGQCCCYCDKHGSCSYWLNSSSSSSSCNNNNNIYN